MSRLPRKNLGAVVKHSKRYAALGGAVILAVVVFYSRVYAEVEIPDQPVDQEIAVMNKENNLEAPTLPTVTEPPKINIVEKPGDAGQAIAPAVTKPIERKPAVSDKIISSTFKSLAKGFVAVADIRQLKKNNIAKIDKMSPEKFNKHYGRAYEGLKDMPLNLREEYKVTADMSKEQVIKDIESLNKSKMYQIIDSIPDTVIADQFRQYLEKTKQEVQKSNVVAEIHKLWNKWIEKAGVK